MCAKSLDDLDNYLQYDWVGAPWELNSRGGGNGGLSLRKVSSIIKVLQHQTRLNYTDLEDTWLSDRLMDLVGGKVANGSESQAFSVETHWYDTPMGYHLGISGSLLWTDVWGTMSRREQIYEYCPEIKMTLDMDLETFIPEFCDEEW